MKAITLFAAVLLLAGIVSCNPVQDNASKGLPDGWLPDSILELVAIIRDIIQSIDLENLTVEQIKEVLQDLADRIRELLQGLEKPDWVEEIEWEQIQAQIRELVARIREFVENIDFENLDLEEFKQVLQDLAVRVREILQEILEGIDLPDLPELPPLPEINTPVAGQQSSIQQYPTVAQIEIGYGPVWVQKCVGSIITNFHVVTGARCLTALRFDIRSHRARVGSGQRNGGGVVHELGSVVIHPGFGRSGDGRHANDIGLARTFGPLALTPAVQPIQIVVSNFEVPAGLPLTIATYGRTTVGGLKPVNGNLHSIDLVSINKATCSAKWASIPILGALFEVGSNNFCAGRVETGGRNIDFRDVGAQLVSNGVLVGALSWGHPVGNQEYPIVATSISPYTSWIVANAV